MPQISVEGRDGSRVITANKLPDTCPVCLHGMEARLLTGRWVRIDGSEPRLEVVYLCPRDACQRTFIGQYRWNGGSDFVFQRALPLTKRARSFSTVVGDVSADFVRIYTQAEAAEQEGLVEICGPGYRKALEFLIKDYLIAEKEKDQANIGAKFLGACIKEDIDDKRIKDVAERAVWLGNDETHYERRWEDKDLSDLKKLIDLVLHWIEAEIATAALLEDMAPAQAGEVVAA